jgi:nickel/cobalt exporter
MNLLLFSTITVGFIHALAPDHWLPFVMISKAQNWGKWKLTSLTTLAGLGHVGSSLLIGALGVLLGVVAEKVNVWETSRGTIASWLLIGFGLAYMVWGMKNWGRKHTHEIDRAKIVSYWTLFALVVFGPCEPLIPLIFAGYAFGWGGVVFVFAIFSGTTIGMMLLQVHLATYGISLLRIHWLEHASDAMAGGVIVLTGVMIMLLGM